MKVADSGLPEFEINSLKRDFENLNKYGSYSGGNITHEFTKAGDLKVALEKNNGLKNILKKLVVYQKVCWSNKRRVTAEAR